MLRKVVDFANVVVSVLAGAYLVLLTLSRTEGLKAVPEGLVGSLGSILLFFFVGAALVVANIYILIKEWKAGGFRRNLLITSDQGLNKFSVSALEMLILRDLKAEPDIVEPGVAMTPNGEGKPMLCEVELKLRRQEDVIKRMDAIKRKICDIIDRLIPGGLTLDILLEVRDFVSENNRNHRDGAGEAGEFNGPVFPNASGGGAESV